MFPKSFGGNILCKQTSTSCTNGSKQNPAPKVTYIYRLVKKQAKLRVKTTSNRKNKAEFAALDLAFKHVFLVFLRPGRQEISSKTRLKFIQNSQKRQKIEFPILSNQIFTLKTMSRKKSECMVFEENFLAFQNIKSDFSYHLRFSRNGSIFKHHFLAKKSRFSSFRRSLELYKSLLGALIWKNSMSPTSPPIFSSIRTFFAILKRF